MAETRSLTLRGCTQRMADLAVAMRIAGCHDLAAQVALQADRCAVLEHAAARVDFRGTPATAGPDAEMIPAAEGGTD